ncbi:MAG: tetratricopeptide repeat protein, partial [bacterium]
GLFHAARGDARAEASFRKAFAVNSQHFAALTDLGIFYLRGGRRKEAEQVVRAALRISPDYPQALRALASMGVVR